MNETQCTELDESPSHMFDSALILMREGRLQVVKGGLLAGTAGAHARCRAENRTLIGPDEVMQYCKGSLMNACPYFNK